MVDEIAWLTGHSEEGLEGLSIKDTTLVLFRAVGHEVSDEVVCVWSNQTGEGSREVVAKEETGLAWFLVQNVL